MFSCRSRGFCPSCHAKRIEEWGEWMRERLLLDVPHRQVVFTVSKRLRLFIKYDRGLLGELCRAALRALGRYFEAVTGSALTPGVIAAIQTFGDRINFHPHLHFLVTEGGTDREGSFPLVPRIDDSRLEEIFAREILEFLVRKVAYRYGQAAREKETMDCLEFIARVTSHIPDKGQVTVRYYGLYANAHRGKVKKASLAAAPLRIVEEELRPVPSKGWAAMIRKVCEVDVRSGEAPASRPSGASLGSRP